jgi:hypothetical protein
MLNNAIYVQQKNNERFIIQKNVTKEQKVTKEE